MYNCLEEYVYEPLYDVYRHVVLHRKGLHTYPRILISVTEHTSTGQYQGLCDQGLAHSQLCSHRYQPMDQPTRINVTSTRTKKTNNKLTRLE